MDGPVDGRGVDDVGRLGAREAEGPSKGPIVAAGGAEGRLDGLGVGVTDVHPVSNKMEMAEGTTERRDRKLTCV